MNDSQKVVITTRSLREMTLAQFESFQENVLAEGKWENQDHINVWIDFDNALMVDIYGNNNGEVVRSILLGIEKDGYCHS